MAAINTAMYVVKEMDEKTMVSDALSEMNASLLSYAYFIEQTSDETLRQKIINSRNDTEAKQYELYKIAKKHGYYQPAAPAQPEEVEKVKAECSCSSKN